MHPILLAAASRAEAVAAFWEGSAYVAAGLAVILIVAVALAHIFRD